MLELKHPNILPIYIQPNTLDIQIEPVESVLRDYLFGRNGVDLCVVKTIIRQVLSVLAFCHARWITHNNLSSGNVFVRNCQFDIYVSNFACKEDFVNYLSYSTEILENWAPEQLHNYPNLRFDPEVDIWAAGCIMVELVKGKPVFNEAGRYADVYNILGNIHTLFQMAEFEPKIRRNYAMGMIFSSFQPYKEFKKVAPDHETLVSILQSKITKFNDISADLLAHMLSYNRKTRITASTALHHPFFHET